MHIQNSSFSENTSSSSEYGKTVSCSPKEDQSRPERIQKGTRKAIVKIESNVGFEDFNQFEKILRNVIGETFSKLHAGTYDHVKVKIYYKEERVCTVHLSEKTQTIFAKFSKKVGEEQKLRFSSIENKKPQIVFASPWDSSDEELKNFHSGYFLAYLDWDEFEAAKRLSDRGIYPKIISSSSVLKGEKEGKVRVIMERASTTGLGFIFLNQKRSVSSPDEAIAQFNQYIEQVLTCIASAHEAGVVLGDLKPLNIVVKLDEKKNLQKVYLIDPSRVIPSGMKECPQGRYSPGYVPNENWTQQLDIFSLGAMILEIAMRGGSKEDTVPGVISSSRPEKNPFYGLLYENKKNQKFICIRNYDQSDLESVKEKVLSFIEKDNHEKRKANRKMWLELAIHYLQPFSCRPDSAQAVEFYDNLMQSHPAAKKRRLTESS